MKNIKFILLVVALSIMVIAPGCTKATKPETTPKNPAPPPRPGVSGFYVNWGKENSLPSLRAHSSILNEIYPLWYHVNTDGSLEEEPDPEAIELARKTGTKILPLINLVPAQDDILRNPTARDRAIANIVQVVKEKDYDGVNIDFEFIPTYENQDFSVNRHQMTLFMKILSGQLRQLGKKTHMCVLPKVNVPEEMAGVYDYGGLAPYVDKVTIMCYDHSQPGGPPGPLAPFSWVEGNIWEAIQQGFKPSKICLGVATYGYDWPAGQPGGFAVPTREIMQVAAMKGYDIRWSEDYQEPYYTYWSSQGYKREVWFENEATLQMKIDLVKRYNLAGICIWRLGFEDRQFWDTIIKNWGSK